MEGASLGAWLRERVDARPFWVVYYEHRSHRRDRLMTLLHATESGFEALDALVCIGSTCVGHYRYAGLSAPETSRPARGRADVP